MNFHITASVLPSLHFTLPVTHSSNIEQKSCKYLTNEGLKSEPNYLKNIKFIIGELLSTLCFSILTSKSQRTPLLRLKFPGGRRLRSSLRAHNGITADDAHLFLDVSICLRGFFFFPPSQALGDLLLSATKNRGTFSETAVENEVK